MSKLEFIKQLKRVYSRGGNILQFLKEIEGRDTNDVDSILISYDFQAGSYTRQAEQNKDYINEYTNAIKKTFDGLPSFDSIMEVGVGEATLMAPLMAKIDPEGKASRFGFDISWSRICYARDNSNKTNSSINFFVGDLFEIPMADSSIDIIYTSHSLEPNGGREKEALEELHRVAKKYVILLEPDYNKACADAKARMEKHGYVRNLAQHARELNFNVIEEKPLGVCINPLNPTGLIILEKRSTGNSAGKLRYVCPISKGELENHGNAFFCQDSGLIYPVIRDIPCLLSKSAILGSHFKDFC